MWASPSVAAKETGHRIIEDARDWEKCSDHVPLITEFDL
jgi:exodeoxyribonuclease-3